MFSSTKQSDIQFQLHFLDCQPNSIIRSLNDKSVLDHLYRAGTNRILKFDKSYQRKEAHRVTDIDQLSLLINSVSSIPKPITTPIPIEMTKTETRKISIPIIQSDNKRTSIEIKTETDIQIPPAPPLPPSLDLAIKLQSQTNKTAIHSPDQASLWANIQNQNVADYFNQLTNPIKHYSPNNTNESKNKTVLDTRKSYNLAMTYDKLARGIRFYYKDEIIQRSRGRFTFRFGWKSGFGINWIPA